MIPFQQLSFWEKESILKNIDFLIIGSGMTGLSTAINLKLIQPDKKVVILERSYLPAGASTKNAGFACIGSPSELLDDLSKEDEDTVFKRVEKRFQGLQYLRDLIGDRNLDFQQLGSYEVFTENDPQFESCREKLSYLNKRLLDITGIKTCFEERNSIVNDFGFEQFNRAIHHAAEGQLNPGKMMLALLKKAFELDVIILNGIEVLSIQNQQVLCNWGKVQFKKMAICTNGLSRSLLPAESIKPARAQVIITEPIESLKFKGIYHFDQGYYYFRNVGYRVLLGGARNLQFKEEETIELETSETIIKHLTKVLQEKILPRQAFKIEDTWAGVMGFGKTKEPTIKKLSKTTFCCIGLGGMGVAIASLLGKDLAYLMSQNNF